MIERENKHQEPIQQGMEYTACCTLADLTHQPTIEAEKIKNAKRGEILNKIFNEDCLITMSRIETGTVDLILQDPPYGTTGNEWDIMPDFVKMWKEWERILKPDGMVVMTASQPFTSKLILSNESLFKYCWVWNKKLAGNGILAKRQPLKIHEDVVVFGKGACRYYPIKRKGVYRAKGGITDKHGTFNGAGSDITFNDEYYPESIIDFSGAGMRSDRIHPTEKPIDLMRYMIQTYTKENETVFDGYMGSGTTAHACIIEKRNYIGSEMNENFYKLLNERLNTELRQPKLF